MATTSGGLPYPTGTDKVVDGDNAIQALAEAVEARFARVTARGTVDAQSVPSGSSHQPLIVIPNDTTGFTFADNAFTTLVEGAYVITGYLSLGTLASGIASLAIYQGGTILAGQTGPATTAGGTRLSVTTARVLSVGQALTLRAFQTSGAALSVSGGNFNIMRIPY